MSKHRSAVRNHVEFAAYRMARGLTGLLPPAGLARIADVLGNFYSMIGGERREIVDFNLALAYPEKSDIERRRLARAVARHFARSALDAIRIQRLQPNELMSSVEISGWEHVERAAGLGRGVFFLTAHIGSWEVAALITGLKLDAGLAVVNRPLDNPLLDAELERLRKLYGNHVFGKHNILREMLGQLKKGGGVGILIDQRTRENQGVDVPFFGQPAWTHPILARVARKTGAPVVPTFALRERPGFYALRYDEAVVIDDLPKAELEDVPLTTRYVEILEQAIRRNPDQWLWYHDRWKQLRLGMENTELGIRNAARPLPGKPGRVALIAHIRSQSPYPWRPIVFSVSMGLRVSREGQSRALRVGIVLMVLVWAAIVVKLMVTDVWDESRALNLFQHHGS